jgi:signal transduction histidine kinase
LQPVFLFRRHNLAFIAIFLLTFHQLIGSETYTIDSLIKQSKAIQYEQKEVAIALIKKARALASDIDDPKLLARLNNQEGAIYYVSGDYGLSLRHFLQAYEWAVKGGFVREKVYATNGRALIHMMDENYDAARLLLEECVVLNTSEGDSLSLAKNHFNLGILYNELTELDRSLKHLKQAGQFMANFPGNKLGIMINNRMAKVYEDMGETKSAFDGYKSVLNDTLILTNWEKTFALTGLARLKYEAGDMDAALVFGEEALSSAKIHGAYWDLQQITELLSFIYREKEVFEKAYMFSVLSKSYGDSLFSEEKSRQIARLQLKLTNAENEKLRAESEISQSQLKQRNRLLFFLILLVLLFGIIIYFYRKNLKLKDRFYKSLEHKNQAIEKQKQLISQQNKALIEVNNTKTRLLSIISHDLRSPINGLKQLLEMKDKGYFSEEEEKQVFDHLTLQVRNAESMLNELLKWANSQMDGMEVNPSKVNLPFMVNEVLKILGFQVRVKFLNINHYDDKAYFITVDKVHLRIIIQNLIGNAIKFTPEYGDIKLYYEIDETFIICHIEDSGVGVDKDYQALINGIDQIRIPSRAGTANEKGTGLGILLVKQFMMLNGGILKTESTPGIGTHFMLYFKR